MLTRKHSRGATAADVWVCDFKLFCLSSDLGLECSSCHIVKPFYSTALGLSSWSKETRTSNKVDGNSSEYTTCIYNTKTYCSNANVCSLHFKSFWWYSQSPFGSLTWTFWWCALIAHWLFNFALHIYKENVIIVL